jgi:hypothetical protein
MAAKEAHELAWQDSDKSFTESETPGDRPVRLPIWLWIITF